MWQTFNWGTTLNSDGRKLWKMMQVQSVFPESIGQVCQPTKSVNSIEHLQYLNIQVV